MRSTLVAATMVVLAMGAAAQADTVGSAPAYGGPTQATVVCYYSTYGSNPVNFFGSQILLEPGNPVAESSDTCNGSVPAGSRCRTVADGINPNGAHWCRATLNNKNLIRGRMEIRNSSGAVLTSEEIR